MQKLKSIGLGLLVALGLAACATGTSEPVSNIQRIGVVSVVGDVLTLQKKGFTVFENASDGATISDWGIDAFIEGEAATYLSRQYSVEAVTVDRTLRDPAQIAYSAAMNAPQPLDAYLIIVPAMRNKTFMQSMSGAKAQGGFKIYMEKQPLLPATVFVMEEADIVLVDGGTFEEIRREALDTGARWNSEPLENGMSLRNGSILIDTSKGWSSKFSEFTPEQLQLIADGIGLLASRSLQYSLGQAGLLQ